MPAGPAAAPAAGLSIVADDRTGALEVAGACAAAGSGQILVGTADALGPFTGSRAVVVDLGSRHLAPEHAAARAAAAERGSGPGAHKIDSTLRGNWAHEVLARQRVRGGRVLVVPALPALGRACVDGVVLEHGRPVAESTGGTDPRGVIGSSRPADLLRAAGAASVAEVAAGGLLEAWLAGALVGGDADAAVTDVAVCDAATNADLERIAQLCAGHLDHLLVAGTSAAVAAVFSAGTGAEPAPVLRSPALVVCGSLHATSRAQVAALVDAGATCSTLDPGAPPPPELAVTGGAVSVLVCRAPSGPAVEAADAEAAAATLAAGARRLLAAHRFPTVVLIGGDTAAAVLGDAVLAVGGTVGAGIPWSHPVASAESFAAGSFAAAAAPVVVTKAGAFGDPTTLVRLLVERTPE